MLENSNKLIKKITNFDIPENWSKHEMSSLFDFYGGMSFSRDSLSDKGVPYLHYGDIHTSSKTYINVSNELETLPKINIELDKIKRGSLLEDGDVVFVDASEDYAGTSKCVVIENEKGLPYISGLHTIIGKSKNDVLIKDYKKFCFENWDLKRQFAFYVTGISVLGLNKSNLEKLIIPIPPKNEQQEIAKILSVQNESIRIKENILIEKKKQKNYLMQSLLNPKSSNFKRLKGFDDEWKTVRISEVMKNVVRGVAKPSEGYWRLGLRSHGKGTFHQFVDDPSKVSMDTLYKVKKNDFIVNITFAWEHAVAVADDCDEGKLVSHRFPTYEFIYGNVPEFFKQYILRKRFKKQLQDISPGGAGRNRVMSKKDFLNLYILIPGADEQLRIADILFNADKEIEFLEQELEQEKHKKKALMQKLLTGKVRVVI